MRSDPQQETQMHTQGTNVRSSLAINMNNGQIVSSVDFQELARVDRAHLAKQELFQHRTTRKETDSLSKHAWRHWSTEDAGTKDPSGFRWLLRAWPHLPPCREIEQQQRIPFFFFLFNNKSGFFALLTFPAFCWDLTRRVALAMQTIKDPVTAGSKVPECPLLLLFF